MASTKGKAAKELEQEDFFGRKVELSNGKHVLVDAWGIAEIDKNMSTIFAMLRDFMAEDEPLKRLQEDEEFQQRFIKKQMNRLTSMIEDSIVGGDIEFRQIKGLNNLISLIEAVIEVNELFEAMGKLTGLATRVTKGLNETMTPTTSPTSSQKTT